MSEWYDSQKQSISRISKLLQERIDKENPRHNLTAEETKRLNKLEAIAEKLKRGENVQNRQLQTWLSAEEYEQFEYEWQEQLELRSELKDKPSDLKRYEEKLKQATFNYNRAEGYSSKGKHVTAKKFYNKSESLCEDALKTVTRTVAVPKTKIVKQEPQQQTTPKDTERTDLTPIRPQPPLPNQQDDRDKR